MVQIPMIFMNKRYEISLCKKLAFLENITLLNHDLVHFLKSQHSRSIQFFIMILSYSITYMLLLINIKLKLRIEREFGRILVSLDCHWFFIFYTILTCYLYSTMPHNSIYHKYSEQLLATNNHCLISYR